VQNSIEPLHTSLSTSDCIRIMDELERILASRFFRISKRYPSFLRYIVEEALQNSDVELKERTIGIEVFGRSPTYDTASDPIVRVAAGEVRKRLAQYYQQPSCANELQIILPVGSYYPIFDLNPVGVAPMAVAIESFEAPATELLIDPLPMTEDEEIHEVLPSRPVRLRLLGWIFSLAAVVVLSMTLRARFGARNPEDQFWAPLLASGQSILLCVEPVGDRPGGNLGSQTNVPLREQVSMSTVFVVSRISRLLGERHVDSEVRSTDLISYYDLQRTPYILIGATDTPWVSRALTGLPFQVRHRSDGIVSVVDIRGPSSRHWDVNTLSSAVSPTEDYGIVARVKDPTTNQVMIVLTGITERGRYAAGRVFAHPEFFRPASVDLSKPNVEMVISTKVIGGVGGPPDVVAAVAW